MLCGSGLWNKESQELTELCEVKAHLLVSETLENLKLMSSHALTSDALPNTLHELYSHDVSLESSCDKDPLHNLVFCGFAGSALIKSSVVPQENLNPQMKKAFLCVPASLCLHMQMKLILNIITRAANL